MKKSNVSNEVIAYIVEEIKQLSDAQPDALEFFGRTLCDAHLRSPDGMTIEVGTRCGGSALLFAKLLDYMYENPPPFMTVDPYGFKVYEGGDHEHDERLRPYHGAHYVTAKSVLAPYPNHCHYYLESMDFFNGLKDVGMWFMGRKLPFHKCASLVFLDGNHDAKSIAEEVKIVKAAWLRDDGTILIDNARNDPKLPSLCPEVTFVGREWAIV